MKNQYQTAKIVKIEKETSIVKNFILDTKIISKPGQYVMVWLPGENEKPFSLADGDPLTLSIAKVGLFTEKLHQLKEGDKLSYRGPYGKGFELKGKRILMVGGGYGTVPLYHLALKAPQSLRKNIYVIIGARTKVSLPFVTKFKAIGCKIMTTTDDGSTGFPVFTTELTQVLLRKKRIDSVYTCGPEIMMKKIAEFCLRKKVFCQISMEKYFKCGGMGLCGECSCKGKLVCVDGPVFNGRFLVN